MSALEILMAIIAIIGVIGLGIFVPYFITMQITAGVLNEIIGLIAIIASVIVAGVLGFFGMIFFIALSESSYKWRKPKELIENRINVYRARQRAMLEELDEIADILKEIRDVLKSVGE